MTNEQFLEIINVDPAGVKESEDGSYKFIPISKIEAKLDQVFDGAWSWDFDREVFGKNYMTGKGRLSYRHPVTAYWVTKSGTAAIALSKEITLDYPHLEALTILNAAKKIGRAFGRDLNRDRDDAPLPSITLDVEPDLDHELHEEILKMDALVYIDEAEEFIKNSPFKYRPELKEILKLKIPRP